MKIYPKVLGNYSAIVEKLMEGYAVYVATPGDILEDHKYVRLSIETRLKEIHGIQTDVLFQSYVDPSDLSVALYFFPDTNRQAVVLLRHDQ